MKFIEDIIREISGENKGLFKKDFLLTWEKNRNDLMNILTIAETLKEVRRALLDADVNYKIAKSFTDRIKEKAIGQDVMSSVKPGELMVKIVHDELADLMGGDSVDININANPAVLLIAGLQGSGKTTFSG